jgi:hypothetical protein
MSIDTLLAEVIMDQNQQEINNWKCSNKSWGMQQEKNGNIPINNMERTIN